MFFPYGKSPSVVHVHPEDIETLSSTLHDQLDERTKEELHEQNMMLFDTLQALQKQKELHEQQLTEQVYHVISSVNH